MNDYKKPIGFIGIGLMGFSLVKRLLEVNYSINAYDKNEEKLKFFQNENKVSICINPAQISQTCDFIFICVDKTENVNDVIFGKNGIIQNASKNTIIVDLSTTLADETINFSKRMSSEKGSSWIDAPVSGGPEKALDGSLAIMVGAEQKDLDIISPILKDISSNFTHFGPVGSGQIVKMINQILVLNNYAILAEALTFAEAWGIDAHKIPNALSDGHAGSNLLTHLFPRMIKKDFKPQGYASQILKDLSMVSKLANQKDIPIPITSLTKQLFTILTGKSQENLDGTSIVKLLDKSKTI
ncbi:NAD(P)-dependent oxidoreductase [Alphaproteobacteria bacterium]|nr:NAD(P)-dependent oxidoreductase [Alphaproteobacteria bacterium]